MSDGTEDAWRVSAVVQLPTHGEWVPIPGTKLRVMTRNSDTLGSFWVQGDPRLTDAEDKIRKLVDFLEDGGGNVTQPEAVRLCNSIAWILAGREME